MQDWLKPGEDTSARDYAPDVPPQKQWVDADGVTKISSPGHWVDGKLIRYPHMCPGEGCAIREWLSRERTKDERES